MSGDALADDWKVKLRYGRLSTPFQHFAVLADGVAGEPIDGLECRPGPAVMSMKGWATDADEAADMLRYVSNEIGFSITGAIEVHQAELDEPPRDRPFAYSINFVPYSEDGDTRE